VRLLIDENLSPRLARRLCDVFPGIASVREIGLRGAPDTQIVRHAAANGWCVVTADARFTAALPKWPPPPMVIHVAMHNPTTTAVEHLLRLERERIRAFLRGGQGLVLTIPSRPTA
jgi:predicted nuclease of predicted toxin-antitoxin system